MNRLLAAGLLVTLLAATPAAAQNSTRARGRNAPPPISVTLHALADTVMAHESAWVEVRIRFEGSGGLDVPIRGNRLVAEWRFENEKGELMYDWPKKELIERAAVLRLGPGDTLYEVLSLETAFGILTEPGTVRAYCRVKDTVSQPIQITRRAAREGDPPSALLAAGPLVGNEGRENIQVRLWAACASSETDYFDCDEALYTVAWDRMQASPAEAQAVVDTLVARAPGSGWCRPAIQELLARTPEETGRRWIDALVARRPGGVAEAYAREMQRRAGYGQFPAAPRPR